MTLVPVPSEQAGPTATCPSCSAAIAPDQHYCLTCGQPVSPVRLAFLDVLQDEHRAYANGHAPAAYPGGAAGAIPAGYAAVIEPAGAPGLLRRYSGLFGLLSVLLLAIVAGLLVGHWVTQSKAPSQQVLKIEGLPSVVASAPTTPLAGAATTTPTASTPTTTTPAATGTTGKSSAVTEAAEAKEAQAIERTPPPKPVKASAPKLKKLGTTTGKKHEQEINSLGAQPIETG